MFFRLPRQRRDHLKIEAVGDRLQEDRRRRHADHNGARHDAGGHHGRQRNRNDLRINAVLFEKAIVLGHERRREIRHRDGRHIDLGRGLRWRRRINTAKRGTKSERRENPHVRLSSQPGRRSQPDVRVSIGCAKNDALSIDRFGQPTRSMFRKSWTTFSRRTCSSMRVFCAIAHRSADPARAASALVGRIAKRQRFGKLIQTSCDPA